MFLMCALGLFAAVRYDEGMLQIQGVTLLQDRDNPNFYHYIPPYPRLAERSDGQLEFFCMKYVSKEAKADNGGLFHALLTFSLPPDELVSLENALRTRLPQARIVGAVPLSAPMGADGKPGASFTIVSSILNGSGMSNSVISSGLAPFLPGTKAAIAARLSPDGASLLWESFQMGTSDVSVLIEGTYEAVIRGYNAVVTANLESTYQHFSRSSHGLVVFDRGQVRSALDSLRQLGHFKVDVFDRTAGTDISAKEMQAVVDLLTEQVLAQLFDAEQGWAQRPNAESPASAFPLDERYKRGALLQIFSGAGGVPLTSETQYRLKSRKDIKSFQFYLNLSRSTTVQVPVRSSGNLRGFYAAHQDDPRYFKVVDLGGPQFQHREVFVQLDASAVEAFGGLLSEVAVAFRKRHGEDSSVTRQELLFLRKDVEKGVDFRSFSYARGGEEGAAWLDYEYRVRWSMSGQGKVIAVPPVDTQWTHANGQVITLYPPFVRRVVEVDVDRTAFKNKGVRTCALRVSGLLFGEPNTPASLLLKEGDTGVPQRITLYADPGSPLVYQATWYTAAGEQRGERRLIDADYLFLTPD
jgi:hypothetical protein